MAGTGQALSLMLTGIISGNKAEEWMKPSGYPQKRGSDNIDHFDHIDNFSKGEPGSSGKENIIVFIVSLKIRRNQGSRASPVRLSADPLTSGFKVQGSKIKVQG